MFIQRGCAMIHLPLVLSGWSTDHRPIFLEYLLEAGAAVNQTVTDGDTWVCICMLYNALTYTMFCYI